MRDIKNIIDEITKEIQETSYKLFWDYNSELSIDQISKIIRGNLCEVQAEIFDLNIDSSFDGQRQLRSEIVEKYIDELSKFMVDTSNVSEVIDQLEDMGYEIEYPMLDENLEELIELTQKVVANYYTGYTMASGSWNWTEAEIKSERIKIKKHLNIFDNSNYDEAIDSMIENATHGGELLVYFELEIKDFIDTDEVLSIQFKNYQIGIIDHVQGSGDILETDIQSTLIVPFNLDNLYLEKEIKYNWTYSIAGMVSNWADSTKVELTSANVGDIRKSVNAEIQQAEAKYNQTYKEGGCTLGDMDIYRHRNVTYINNYPCGNKCKDCGNFWID